MQHVFLHGGGRSGHDAWPHLDPDAGIFVAFDKHVTIAERVAQLEQDFRGAPLVLFAHSLGGVPAVLAAARGALDVRALVLIEPALYDIARGSAPIERHIAIQHEARDQAASGSLRGYWMMVRPLMFGGSFDAQRWPEEQPLAELWAQAETPWGHGVRAEMITGIPTLVVTGGWNAEYDTIAEILAAQGAEHQVLPGADHRPQDLPGFAPVVDEFLARARL